MDKIERAEQMLAEARRLRQLAEDIEHAAAQILEHERAAAAEQRDGTVHELRPRPKGDAGE